MISSLLTMCLIPFRGYDLFMIPCGIIAVTGLFQIVWKLVRHNY